MLKNVRPLAAVAAAVLSLNTYAEVEMYLKFEGLSGNSIGKNYNSEIDILAWSWGASQSGTTHLGGDSAGKANFQDLSLTKFVDEVSVPLIKLVSTGDQIDAAILSVEYHTDPPFIFEELVMYEVLVTSVSTGGSGGEDKLTEFVTLNFESFCITYTEKLEGGGQGQKPSLCFNIAANKTCTVAQVETLMQLPLVMSLPTQITAGLNPVCETS